MVFVADIISIIIFCGAFVAFGFFMGYRSKKGSEKEINIEDFILAGRKIGVLVGICTMIATWIGGGFILGTAETIYSSKKGLVWCIIPISYSLSLALSGLFYAKRMRQLQYVTMIDPFYFKYGEKMSVLLLIPALFGDIGWFTGGLTALGATAHSVIGIHKNMAILIAVCVVTSYTLFGGFHSILYTDMIQLICTVAVLFLVLPFVFTNQHVRDITDTFPEWRGKIESHDIGVFLDAILMTLFGSIPWQVYFQRVLACETGKKAAIVSVSAAGLCCVFAIPPMLLGAVAKGADWTAAGNKGVTVKNTIPEESGMMILPLVVHYFCPRGIDSIATGAISAAIMSSVDCSMLSAASMFSRNIVQSIVSKSVFKKYEVWILRAGIILTGIIGCMIAIFINSLHALWLFCSDMVYVLLFPQLTSALYIRFSNTYGSLTGFVVGFLFRLATGASYFGLSPLIKFPYHYKEDGVTKQRFPVSTIAMLVSFGTLLLVSKVTDYFFTKDKNRLKYDIFNCYQVTVNDFGCEKICNRINRKYVDIFNKTSQPTNSDEIEKEEDERSVQNDDNAIPSEGSNVDVQK